MHNILFIVASSLEEIELAPLTRPAVYAPNEELVLWGIRFYVQCVIAHLRTILRGLVQLTEAGNVPTAFVLCRHVFEWTAHTCYMSRNLKNYLMQKQWKRAWHLLSLATEGNRWAKEHGPKYAPTIVTDGIPDPLSIANVVTAYEEYQHSRMENGMQKTAMAF